MTTLYSNDYSATSQLVTDAIRGSGSSGEIVRINAPARLLDAIEDELWAACDGDAATESEHEFWGTYEDDDTTYEWRVHVVLPT